MSFTSNHVFHCLYELDREGAGLVQPKIPPKLLLLLLVRKRPKSLPLEKRRVGETLPAMLPAVMEFRTGGHVTARRMI